MLSSTLYKAGLHTVSNALAYLQKQCRVAAFARGTFLAIDVEV